MSIDSRSRWLKAKFLHKPTTTTVLELLKNYLAMFWIPTRTRTYLGSPFMSAKFRQFCWERFNEHFDCPIVDHRGNGKIRSCIRTVTEHLWTNNRVVLETIQNFWKFHFDYVRHSELNQHHLRTGKWVGNIKLSGTRYKLHLLLFQRNTRNFGWTWTNFYKTQTLLFL